VGYEISSRGAFLCTPCRSSTRLSRANRISPARNSFPDRTGVRPNKSRTLNVREIRFSAVARFCTAESHRSESGNHCAKFIFEEFITRDKCVTRRFYWKWKLARISLSSSAYMQRFKRRELRDEVAVSRKTDGGFARFLMAVMRIFLCITSFSVCMYIACMAQV